jgi:hypothetical protein
MDDEERLEILKNKSAKENDIYDWAYKTIEYLRVSDEDRFMRCLAYMARNTDAAMALIKISSMTNDKEIKSIIDETLSKLLGAEDESGRKRPFN